MTGTTSISNANNNSSSIVNDCSPSTYDNTIGSVSVNKNNEFIGNDIIVPNSNDNFTKSDSFSALFNVSTPKNPENYDEFSDDFSPQTDHSPTDRSRMDHFSDKSEQEKYFMSLMKQRNKNNKKKLKRKKAPDGLVSTSMP